MNNADIALVFEEVADLLELRGENAFRVRAYRQGAKAIEELVQPVSAILAETGQDLTAYAGIGSTIAEKCAVLVATGKLPLLEELRANTPPVLIKLTRIPGFGAKKAATLQRELNLQSLDELREACEQQRVRKLKGFAAKTEQLILAGLEIAEAAAQRLRIDQAERLAARLKEHLSACPHIKQLEFAGSLRRFKETVGDIDMLVTSDDPPAVMDTLESFPRRLSTIARGDTKMSIRVDEQFQVDLRVVAETSFGAALQYFTGSKEHNVAVRSRARGLGMTLNEYGVRGWISPTSTSLAAPKKRSTPRWDWSGFHLNCARVGMNWTGMPRAMCLPICCSWGISLRTCTCTPTRLMAPIPLKKWRPPPGREVANIWLLPTTQNASAWHAVWMRLDC